MGRPSTIIFIELLIGYRYTFFFWNSDFSRESTRISVVLLETKLPALINTLHACYPLCFFKECTRLVLDLDRPPRLNAASFELDCGADAMARVPMAGDVRHETTS